MKTGRSHHALLLCLLILPPIVMAQVELNEESTTDWIRHFYEPKSDGYLVDRCWTSDRSMCGQEVADRFCEDKNLSSAEKFLLAERSNGEVSTIYLGSSAECQSECQSFLYIGCVE